MKIIVLATFNYRVICVYILIDCHDDDDDDDDDYTHECEFEGNGIW